MLPPSTRDARAGLVLLIESDPALGRLLVELLAPRRCLLFSSAAAALAALESFTPAAVAVDFRLPHGDALDLYRALRERTQLARVVLAPGSLDARALSGMELLAQPFEPAALLQVLRALDERHAPAPPPRRRSRDQLPIWLPAPLSADQHRVLSTLAVRPLNAVSVREAVRGQIAPRRVTALLRELANLGLVERLHRTQWHLTNLGRETLGRHR